MWFSPVIYDADWKGHINSVLFGIDKGLVVLLYSTRYRGERDSDGWLEAGGQLRGTTCLQNSYSLRAYPNPPDIQWQPLYLFIFFVSRVCFGSRKMG